MSNSKLISYTKISPNKSIGRNHKIDTITIHCYVGQASVESAGEWFSRPTTQASCNYMIGKDGRIALIVDENDRSWCSSSPSNDNRAVTIECASDAVHPYAVNDKVYSSLIKLCADICKRNGIAKLVWSTDKNKRVNHLDGCNMTVHRDYKMKACPGEYLYSRHGQIAAEVNKLLAGALAKPTTTKPAKTTNTKPATATKIDVTYRTKYAKGWLPWVKNATDYAGIRGKTITGLQAKVSAGKIKYRVYGGGKWSSWVYDGAEASRGGASITAVEMYLYSPNSDKCIYYKVSPSGKAYYPVQIDNTVGKGMDGYAGNKRTAIDRILMWIR